MNIGIFLNKKMLVEKMGIRFPASKLTNTGIANLSKILVALMLATILFGCSTTALNIKSSGELSGKKLLTCRFVFYNDDVHIENGEGFSVFFKEREDDKLTMFQPDEEGYVYIPVDEGQYYISRIKFNKLNGHLLFPVHQDSGINVDISDTVVNLGTIHISLQQNITSKIAYVSTYGYPYAGKLMPSSLKPELSVTQIPGRDIAQRYLLLSKLDILPESIRDEVVYFSEEVETPFR